MFMKNYLVDTDWFDYHFLGDFLYSDHRVKEFLNKPRYSVGKENISSRVLNHWHDMGIINDSREGNKGWRKFSISEMLWITIIVKLRNFGVDLKKIKDVKEYLDTYNSNDNISNCPLIDFYIVLSFNSQMPIKLLVFSNGESLIGRQVAIDESLQLGLITEDYISIDLSRLVKEKINGRNIETDYLNYSLTEIEKEFSKSININSIKSLEIKLKNGSFYLSKEHIYHNRDEIKSILHNVGDYYEQSVVKKGRGKYYKLTEEKVIKK